MDLRFLIAFFLGIGVKVAKYLLENRHMITKTTLENCGEFISGDIASHDMKF